MQAGVFIPINSNGWLLSETVPQYMPSFELNRDITLAAERHRLDFVLSMVKLHGLGAKTEFWDHGLESFTLMAGLAAVTTHIRLFASVATLTILPAIAARMCVTIGSISGGRFGLNSVTGWRRLSTIRWAFGPAIVILPAVTRYWTNTPPSCAILENRVKHKGRFSHHGQMCAFAAAVCADKDDLCGLQHRGHALHG
ncbi:LLM class flavin-dependent oxidoreductase [Belnapia arida]|nr:LLM class flavin-dependent oxidoreductase [Belnapia arida]